MKSISVLVIPFLALALSSCAHHRDVRAGIDGFHKVSVQASDKQSGQRDAISQANHFCETEQGNTRAAILDEKTSYTGSLDEATRNNVRQASGAAMAVGNMLGSASGEYGQHPVGIAGSAGYMMTSGLDYTVEMKFKCQR